MFGCTTNIIGAGGYPVFEVILGFVVDQTKYWSNLRKHHVSLRPDVEDLFGQQGVVDLSRGDLGH